VRDLQACGLHVSGMKVSEVNPSPSGFSLPVVRVWRPGLLAHHEIGHAPQFGGQALPAVAGGRFCNPAASQYAREPDPSSHAAVPPFHGRGVLLNGAMYKSIKPMGPAIRVSARNRALSSTRCGCARLGCPGVPQERR
jgi:hypothetical protein